MATSVDSILVKSAAQALIQRLNSSASNASQKLLEDDPDLIYIQVQLKKKLTRKLQSPVRVKIPNALFGSRSPLTISVCLICKTEDKEAIQQALQDGLENEYVKEVISLADLKKRYKEFKAQKQLIREHTHFICTSAVQRQVYQLLGPNFGRRHLLPVVIRDNIPRICQDVHKVISSTYFHLAGDNLGIRIAHAKMSPQQIADNVIAGSQFLSEKIQGGWKNVHSIHIKSAFSASIPIYSRAESELVSYLQEKVRSPAKETTTKAAKKSKGEVKESAKDDSKASVGKTGGTKQKKVGAK
jgi:ribosome biogenesis protein UTP30